MRTCKPITWHPCQVSEQSPSPALLDLRDYVDRERALALAADGCPQRYSQIVAAHLGTITELETEELILFGSFASRMRGLHEGVLREISANNPHAAFPLLRAFLEVTTIALYVSRNPTYQRVLLDGPGDGRPGRKSFASMFHAVQDDAEQLNLVYSELSDYTHFGQLGVWGSHSVDEDSRSVVVTDVPRWRSETHFQIACALSRELAHLGQDALHRVGAVIFTESHPGATALSDQ